MSPLPTYYLCHGGGPWPWMDGPFRRHFDQLEASLTAILPALPGLPRAVLVVSGHWEAPEFQISAHPNPPMLYDYSGFPPFAYQVQYPAPGDPELAEQVSALLGEGGMVNGLDHVRGFDHGTFDLMAPIRPQADIPVVQLSIRQDFDVAAHLEVGRLLAPLRGDNVLILGSGMSYHNLGALGLNAAVPSRLFDNWLRENLVDRDGAHRAAALTNWDRAPAARIAQPHPDHLLPLMVAAGAAESDQCSLHFHEARFFGNVAISAFRFG